MLAILANVIPHFYTLVAYFIYILNPYATLTLSLSLFYVLI